MNHLLRFRSRKCNCDLFQPAEGLDDGATIAALVFI